MTVLVTGGAGFIGSHLVEGLLEQGRKVRVLDDLSTGKRENLDIDHRNLDLRVGDVCDRQFLESCMQGVSAVAHLAAIASVQATVDSPVAAHRVNFGATLEVLEAARLVGVPRVIFASSAAVYGDSAPRPAAEMSRLWPASPYASDKLASEHYLEFYARQFGLSTLALRFFNVYGPRQDPHSPYSGVISIFAERGLLGQQVTVFGDGEQSRDFIYVGDVKRTLIQGLFSSVTGSFNLGTGRETSLNRLIEHLSTLLGRPIERIEAGERVGDIRHSCANNAHLLQAFGPMGFTKLEIGLESYLDSLTADKKTLS